MNRAEFTYMNIHNSELRKDEIYEGIHFSDRVSNNFYRSNGNYYECSGTLEK